MAQPAVDRIHALEIPLHDATLLVPSANVAEVTHPGTLTAVPLAPAWLLGVMSWRTLAVPVVSFEALMGGAPAASTPGSSATAPGVALPPPSLASKVVVFYPLSGRRDWEFYGVRTHAEPHPQTVDSARAVAATRAELPDTSYVAAGLKLGGRLLVIPDLDALKKAFYP